MPETAEQYIGRIMGYVEGLDAIKVQRATAATLKKAIQGLSSAQLKWRSAPGKWSISEILAHLTDAEIVASWRMRSVIGENGITIQPFDQDSWASVFRYQDRDARQSLETFRVLRENNLAMLKEIPREIWENHGLHLERGKETISHQARMFAGHDTNHILQGEMIVKELKSVKQPRGAGKSTKKKRHSGVPRFVPTSAKTNVVGAAPEGASDRQSAARAVRDMFTSIAPRYDVLNHVLSFNIDRIWWRRTARTFRHILANPKGRVLDLCCGTGDMAFALQRQAEESSAQILGADFSHAMLQRATYKAARSPRKQSLGWIEADALKLPFPDKHFDLVTSAFGFRNLADYDAGLQEILRVLAPGGQCGILDFGEPDGVLGALYRVYFKQVLPRIGAVISGIEGPYKYLPASVERFPRPEEMLMRMKDAGFATATWTPYSLGIAGLYQGGKAE